MLPNQSKSEAPEVAASEASMPIPHVTIQKGDTSMSQAPDNRDRTVELLADAGSLTELARRWLVGAERALPADAPLFAAVDIVNALTYLKKAAEKIKRAEVALNADNPHPVDPTGPLTIGTIPDADLDRMIDATIPTTEGDQ